VSHLFRTGYETLFFNKSFENFAQKSLRGILQFFLSLIFMLKSLGQGFTMTPCSRHEKLLALAMLCKAQAWSRVPTAGRAILGVRGGSTNALDESFLIESFQDEVLQMRREIQHETDALMQELRQEIMDAKRKGLFERKKVSDEYTVEEENEVEDEEREDELIDALDKDVPSQEEQEKIQLFEDADDDFLVGDSDEEPDSVLGRMKARVKPEDLVIVPEETEEGTIEEAEDLSAHEEEEMISHLAHSDADMAVQSKISPKPKRKKKKKPPTQLAGSEEEEVPKKKKAKKKKAKKKKAKKKKATKSVTSKEVVQTALSSKTEGDRVLLLKSPNALQALVKGVVLAVLLGLAMLVLRVVEKSVTSTITSTV
jgi:hypothetical protein